MDSQAAQFHLALIVVSPLNALDQIDTKKHNDASKKTYNFREVKVRQSLEKIPTKINMTLIFRSNTVNASPADQIKYPVPASQHK